ncbi:MAG: UDP-N-acetylmuramoyl-tripeptide--D-alanyl-D-alanine ligase [Deltaproteobacteria bacterium]|nr:UDP-N-acetylmuramoyl-tripeptide--D-alanyl-D-alanine ligase [Deltaproteobacteria bacterium]
MELTVHEIVKATGGVLKLGIGDGFVKGISTDSRKACCGEVFFALKGQNFDGHRFIKEVAGKGAIAAVVETAEEGGLPSSFNLIVVDDTLKALGRLAAYVRGKYRIPVIAVTGSAGKTTTKEMIASILSRSKNILKTEGNKNNLIGLPLTLFGLHDEHEAAVLELGISEFWEMERLVDICKPDIVVITNIGRGHLQTLGSLEGVAKAKGPLFTLLKEGGVKVVNLDDPWVVKIAEGKGNIITYSLKEEADVRVTEYRAEDGFGGVTATYNVMGSSVRVRFRVPGITNVVNGAAAIATLLPLGVSLEDIEEGLNAYAPVRGRMEVVKAGGFTILDDTYNANPESMSSALKTLSKAAGRKVAVVGDMLELGEASKQEHRNVGALAAELGIDVIVAIGNLSDEIVEGVRAAGKDALGFKDKQEAIKAVKEIIKTGDTVLVKASRGVALEQVVEALKGMEPKKPCNQV